MMNGALWDLLESGVVLYIVLTFLLCIVVKKAVMSTKNNLPGPWGLPIVGYLPFLKPTLHESAMKLAQRYGSIFRVRIGGRSVVIVNGRKAIREVLVQKFETFAGRPAYYSSRIICKGKSLAFSSIYNSAWKMQKSICKNSLQEFANAQNYEIQDIIRDAGDELVDTFLSFSQAFDPGNPILMCTSSIIYQICYGKGTKICQDKRFLERLSNIKALLKLTKNGTALNIFPWLRFVMPWRARQFCNLLNANSQSRYEMIKEHQEYFDPNAPRDLTDSIILATIQNKDERHSIGLTDEHIFAILEAVETAGFETTATILHWAVLFMAKFLCVQEKVHCEIADNLGTRPPQLSDKDSLKFTMATILEIMRMSSILPMSLSHAATKDVVLNNCHIAKGTPVLINLYSLSFDTDFWKDPNIFRPERFLDENGDLDSVKMEFDLPFSAGRRRCLGEKLARSQIFLIFVALIQRCRITKPDGIDIDLNGECGLMIRPRPNNIIVTEWN